MYDEKPSDHSTCVKIRPKSPSASIDDATSAAASKHEGASYDEAGA